MEDPKKAVVVTGSSSGIGRAVALHLAQHDFTVFATMRNPADSKRMDDLHKASLIPIANVDLAQGDQIQAAVNTIKSTLQSMGLDGLYAIINNAGGGAIAPLELLNMDIMERELKTRVIGPARLVQLLLPEIRKGKGRLLWITTPSLMPLPYKSSIHVAEFATHGLARTFRIELSPWNIPSIMIACGGIKSNAVGRMDQELSAKLNSWPQEQLSLYGSALKEVLERDAKIAESGIDPVRVAETVEEALRSTKPKTMYKVGVSEQFSSLSSLPEEKVDEFFISMITHKDK
jgi:NAD(P)-dependent dehydrogenase (short-subunit alcohol dehydrogenase family)